MAQTHEVELRIADRPFTHWDEVILTHDLLSAGSAITVTLWRSRQTLAVRSAGRQIVRAFAPMEVYVDGALQFVGTVERVRSGADREGAKFVVSGRDLSAAMLASDVDPRLSLRGVTLATAIERAVEPLGLSLVVAAEAAQSREIVAGRAHPRPPSRARHAPARTTTTAHRTTATARRAHRGAHVDQWKPRPGEKIWQFCEHLARRHGFLLFVGPTPEGQGLILDKPNYDAEPLYALNRIALRDGAEYEGNLLAGWTDVNVTQVPSSVTAFARSSLLAETDVRLRARRDNASLIADDIHQPPPARPRYVQDPRSRTLAHAQQRARSEIARANERLFTYEATVQGWGQGEHLYAINEVADLRDDVEGIRDRYLVTRVAMRRSRQSGHTTEMTLSRRGSIELVPEEG